MNLHIVPDSGIVDAFYENLNEAGLLANNKIVVRTNEKRLRYSKKDLPFAQLYSSTFKELVGDTLQYEHVYVHQLSPLMYRWIATHAFNKLSWLIWGADLYNLPSIDFNIYEKLTLRYYVRKIKPLRTYLYLLKVWITNRPFRNQAYSRIDFVLTWMKTEYEFATQHIPSLKAGHQFFFYENQIPYHQLDQFIQDEPKDPRSIIIGNSGVAENNHLDAVQLLSEKKIEADLYLPVSYGDPDYIRFLKKNLKSYAYGKLQFVDQYMNFEEYVSFLAGADALIMNTIRPQGYGNILMMLYMNKPVFLNDQNISLPDLKSNGVGYCLIDEIGEALEQSRNFNTKEAVTILFSHDRLLEIYRELFGV